MAIERKAIDDLKRILIVDDDQVIRLSLRTVMRDAGFEVVGEAHNGLRAMEVMKKQNPAIVLLDIEMPGVSGLDVLADIREKYPRTKVVMISGSATSEYVSTAMKLGASGFVVKPFNFNNVVSNIQKALISAAKSQAEEPQSKAS